MYKSFGFFLFIMGFSQFVFSQTVINKTLLFEVNDYSLSQDSEEILSDLLSQLKSCDESTLQIIGHSDKDGTDAYNLILSKKRAIQVEQFFLKSGYAIEDIQVDFLGESDPLINDEGLQSKQRNRRVTIKANLYSYSSVNDFVSLLETDREDSLSINQIEKTEFVLSKGTHVSLPANAFCYQDGSPLNNDKVDLEFKEAFDYTKMVDERLFTQTADRMLETGGMIYIEARQNGIPLRLKDGKEIVLTFPKQKSKKGMELFTGIESEGDMIWEETGQNIGTEQTVPFIQVDLSPLKNAMFNSNREEFEFPVEDMPKYPKATRKPNPPGESVYSADRYAEVFEDYEKKLAEYNKDQESITEKQEAWIEEANRRKELFIQHRRNYIIDRMEKWTTFKIEQLIAKGDKVSHISLLGGLEEFLGEEIGVLDYNTRYYRDKIFKGAVYDIVKYSPIYHTDYSKYERRKFFPNLRDSIFHVNRTILDRKMELGIVDKQVLSSYVVSTSSLGWINCDRFYDVEESQKTDLQFAQTPEGEYYYLVFKDIKSLMRPRIVEGQVIFTNIPKGADVRIVSLGMKDEDCFIASQDLILGSDETIDMQYRPAKLKDMRKILEQI